MVRIKKQKERISNGVKYPNFKEEKKLYNRGHRIVVGIDEVGRGPLAGPVVAAAFCIRFRHNRSLASIEAKLRRTAKLRGSTKFQIKNSKQLSAKQREEIYEILKRNPNVEWGIGRVSEKVIDKINIFQATKLAMQKSVRNLEKKLEKKTENWLVLKSHDRGDLAPVNLVDFLIIDGNFGIDIDIPQKSIIKGDQKVFSVAAASIVAKVTRDRLMIKYHKKYPDYGFDRHKGYGTEFHRESINKYGFCKIHRKSFKIS